MLFSKLLNLVKLRAESPGHRPGRPVQAKAPPCRPCVEALESRVVLNDGFAPHPIDIFRDAIVYTPIVDPHGTGVTVEHIHPHVTIIINGVEQVIPAGIGWEKFGPGTGMPIHTHDASGTLHVESMLSHRFQLQDFFGIWGQTFNSQEILGHHADADHPIIMTVNGQPSTAYGSLPLFGNPSDAFFSESGDQIVIRLDGVP